MSTRNGIKNNFRDYVMDIDVSSPCERISDIELLLSRETTFKFEHDIDWCIQTRRNGVDLDRFKQECGEIENE